MPLSPSLLVRRFLKQCANREVFFLTCIGILGVAVSFNELFIVWPLVVLYAAFVWRYRMSYLLVSRLPFPKWIHRILLILHIPLAFSFLYPRLFIFEILVFLLIESLIFAQVAMAINEPERVLRKVRITLIEALLALFALAGVFLTSYVQLILILWGMIATDITLYIIFFRQIYLVPAHL